MKKKIAFTIDTTQLETDLASHLPFDTVKENIDVLLGTVQDMIMNAISLSPYTRARIEMVTGNIWKTIDAFEQRISQYNHGSDEWCELIFSLGLMYFQVRDEKKSLLYWEMLAQHTPQSEQQEEWQFLASFNVSMQYYTTGKIVQAVDIREQFASLPDSSSERKQLIIDSSRMNIHSFYNQYIQNPSPFTA